MLPKWLLPDALPEMNIKSTRRNAPMIDSRGIAIARYNERRREALLAKTTEEQRQAAARKAARARWEKKIPVLP